MMTQADNRKIVRDGLGRASAKRKIVIVGAGMAGLTAAYELHRANHEVVVLEAQPRVGGRILTLREPFTHDLYAEAGAMRIPEEHLLVRDYLTKLLRQLWESLTEEFKSETTNDIWYVNGKFWSKEEADEARKRLDGKWAKAISSAREAFSNAKDKETAVKELDRCSIWEFLKTRHYWNEDDVELFAVLNNVESLLSSTGILEFERDDAALSAEKFYQIRGGMERLPNAFLPELAPYLRFGARVKEVNWHEKDKVKVRYTVGSKDHGEEGDAAILAVPVPVLRQMWFVPQLSPEKRRAIRQLHYDSATKIFLQFRERFWEEEAVHGGSIVTDHPIRTAYFPSSGRCNDRGVLLASYTWGDDALIWGSLPEPARINQALRGITHLFQRKGKRVDVRRLFEGGVSKSWHEDPFAGGAFALFQPGQQQLHKHIVSHEGPIYFAGEHTTLRHAWIEGAIESGIRTAQALFQRFEGGAEVDLSKDFTE